MFKPLKGLLSVVDPTVPLGNTPLGRVVDALGSSLDITRSDSLVSHALETVGHHTDITNDSGLLGGVARLLTGPASDTEFRARTPIAMTNAPRLGASSVSRTGDQDRMIEQVFTAFLSNEQFFASLLRSAFGKTEMILLVWEILGERIPNAIRLSLDNVAAETVRLIANRPMERTLLIAEAARRRPGRAEFFTAYLALTEEYNVFGLPTPKTPQELNLNEIAERFGGEVRIPKGFNRDAFEVLAFDGHFGQANELSTLARRSWGEKSFSQPHQELFYAVRWLSDTIGDDPARQALILARVAKDKAIMSGGHDSHAKRLYAGIAAQYDLPLPQDPKDLDLNAIAARFGIADYAARTAIMQIPTSSGTRSVSEEDALRLVSYGENSYQMGSLLMSAGYTESNQHRSLPNQNWQNAVVALIAKNETGHGDPVFLLQEISGLKPYREDLRQFVAELSGEAYEPMPNWMRYKGDARLNDSESVNREMGGLSFTPSGLSALFDIAWSAWGNDIERIQNVAKQIGVRNEIPDDTTDTELMIWKLVGAANRHGTVNTLLTILAADAPTDAALYTFLLRRNIASNIKSRKPSQSRREPTVTRVGAAAFADWSPPVGSALAEAGLEWKGHQLLATDREKFTAYLKLALDVETKKTLFFGDLLFADLGFRSQREFDLRDDEKITEALLIFTNDAENLGLLDMFLVRLHQRRPDDPRTAAIAREILAAGSGS